MGNGYAAVMQGFTAKVTYPNSANLVSPSTVAKLQGKSYYLYICPLSTIVGPAGVGGVGGVTYGRRQCYFVCPS